MFAQGQEMKQEWREAYFTTLLDGKSLPNAKTESQAKEIMAAAKTEDDNNGPGQDKQRQQEWEEAIQYYRALAKVRPDASARAKKVR